MLEIKIVNWFYFFNPGVYIQPSQENNGKVLWIKNGKGEEKCGLGKKTNKMLRG